MPLPARLTQASPAPRISALRSELTRLDERIRRDVHTITKDRRQRLERAVARLDNTNPLAVLARGYAMATERDSGAIIKRVAQVAGGNKVDVRVSDGRLLCTVDSRQADD